MHITLLRDRMTYCIPSICMKNDLLALWNWQSINVKCVVRNAEIVCEMITQSISRRSETLAAWRKVISRNISKHIITFIIYSLRFQPEHLAGEINTWMIDTPTKLTTIFFTHENRTATRTLNYFHESNKSHGAVLQSWGKWNTICRW